MSRSMLAPRPTAPEAAPLDVERKVLSHEERHVVQFYEDDRFLADTVGAFLQVGLQAGEAAVVIATDAHRSAFADRLATRGIDARELCASGRLTLLDAEGTLARLAPHGTLDASACRRIVGGALAAAAAQGRDGRFRAFGEVVDLLWRLGHIEAALDLEAIWNELGAPYSMSLLCAYRLANFPEGRDAAVFADVCRAHTKVMPTESFLAIADPVRQLREISILQQQANALALEVEHRKKAEAALQEALRVRDDFLSVAGHELRTPLTVLRLQLASLLSNGRKLEDGRLPRRLEILAAQTERLTNLSARLLDVTQLESPLNLSPWQLDLTALVRESVDAFADIATAAGSPIALVVGGPDSGPVVGCWDGHRLQQVMQDLLSNALKFGLARPVHVTVMGRLDGVEIAVRDDGPGIAPEDLTRIFDRFERRAPAETFAGLGLGLWIARRVVEAHGGTIRVDSRPGCGATFTVRLPYGAPTSPSPAPGN